ncbi:MAG: type II secretion system F family protein [Thermoguttaceae bacterium]
MAEFDYIARDLSGQRVTGTVAAANRREALAMIAGRSLFPVEIKGTVARPEVQRRRRVRAQVLATMYGQLADLLRSGVPLLRALDVLRKQTAHKGMAEVLDEVHRQVEQGASLADAMHRFPRVFGEMAVSMVRAGGEGGFLEEALSRVAEFTEAQDDLKKRVLGAIAYPAFLTVVGTAIVIVLLVFFVPKFDALFANLRQRGELPVVTDWVLGTSQFLQDWWLWIFGGGVVGLVALNRWFATDAGRLWRDRLRLRLPLMGGIVLSLAIARFCRVLGTLLRNGVPILRSLEISSDATANRVLAGAIQQASEDVSAGQRLAGRLAACGHFPPAVVEMIAVAEESNTLESVLVTIADSLERRTWRRLDLAVRLLEPVLLLLLAGVVLVLVIALLLPVIKMSTTIK